MDLPGEPSLPPDSCPSGRRRRERRLASCSEDKKRPICDSPSPTVPVRHPGWRLEAKEPNQSPAADFLAEGATRLRDVAAPRGEGRLNPRAPARAAGVPPSPTAAPRPSGSPSAKARPLSAARSSGLCPDRSGSRPRCSRLSRRPPGQDAPAHPVTSPDSRRGRARSDHLPSTLPADGAALALLSSARGPRPGRTDPGCPRKRPLTAGAVPPSPCMSLQSSPTSLPPVSPRGGAG